MSPDIADILHVRHVLRSVSASNRAQVELQILDRKNFRRVYFVIRAKFRVHSAQGAHECEQTAGPVDVSGAHARCSGVSG